MKPDAEDMSYFSHYDRFYSLLTVAIMVVIVSAFDVNTVSNPKSFMTLYAENKGPFYSSNLITSLTSLTMVDVFCYGQVL